MKNWPEGYLKKMEEVLGDSFVNGEIKLSISFDNETEAKLEIKKLKLMKKQLAQIKKDAIQDLKSLEAQYNDEIKGVQAGFFSSLFNSESRDRENQRRDLRKKREADALKLKNVKGTVDDAMLSIDSGILQIEEIIVTKYQS